MISFFFEIGVFTAKLFISLLVFGIFLMLIAGFALQQKKYKKKKKRLELEDVGDLYQGYKLAMQSILLSGKELKKQVQLLKKRKKQEKAGEQDRVYVLNFDGDIQARQVKQLRDEVSLLVYFANPEKDEILVRLNNRGGMVPNHGLAASQLQRLRDKGFKLTICVDEVAASGGYLMACTASVLMAAPFAYIGSIGVLAQIPNLHRFLQKKEVDFEEHYAGKHKRTLTLFGKATDEKREKLKAQLEEIHRQFQNYISSYRPQLNLEKVATGEVWLGEKAKTLGLVDSISTSDAYLLKLLDTKKVYHLSLKEEESKGLRSVMDKLQGLKKVSRSVLDRFLT